jgi:hypothetical protein
MTRIQPILSILADWKAAMARKTLNADFNQTLDTLRAHSFDVSPYDQVAGGMLVSKHGAAAVLVPGQGVAQYASQAHAPAKQTAVVFAIHPGVLVRGEVARLLDRGYQKFIRTSQYELPATAAQLQGIHMFSEELNQLTGVVSLYNQALGTTSDVYQYDRLKNREAVQSPPARPWEKGGGH